MPASLLDSQLATLEAPDTDEPALRLDAGTPPESLVQQIRAHLNLSPETVRNDRP